MNVCLVSLYISLLLNIFTALKSGNELSHVQINNSRAAECLVKYIYESGLKPILVCNEESYTKEETQAVFKKLTEIYKYSNKFNVAVKTCGKNNKYIKKRKLLYEQFIVFADSVAELNSILTRCIHSEWSSTAHFVIITNPTANVEAMLEVLKRNFICKALLVTSWNERFVSSRNAKPRCPQIHYSNNSLVYDCLSNTDYQRSEFDLSGVVKCIPKLGIRLAYPYTRKLSDREVKRYNLLFAYVGEEIHNIGLITNSESMPFPVSKSNELGEYIDEARVGYGLMKELVDGDIDILIGALHNIENRSTSIDASYPLMYANLICVVKKRVKPNILNLVNVFDWSIWLLVLSLVILLVFTIYIMHNYYSSFSIITTVFTLLSILIGQHGSIIKKHTRLIFIAWIWICFILRSSYEAYTTQLFINKDSITQVESLDEVCRNNYTVLVPEYNHALFNKGYHLEGCYIPPENFIAANDSLEKLLESDSEFVSVFMYRRALLSYLGGYTDVEGRIPFHIIKEEVSLVPLFNYFRRGDPLKDMFQKRGMTVLEAGLIVRYRRIIDETRNQQTNDKMRSLKSKPELSIKRLAFVFYIFLCGVLISVITFCIEILCFKYLSRS